MMMTAMVSDGLRNVDGLEEPLGVVRFSAIAE